MTNGIVLREKPLPAHTWTMTSKGVLGNIKDVQTYWNEQNVPGDRLATSPPRQRKETI